MKQWILVVGMLFACNVAAAQVQSGPDVASEASVELPVQVIHPWVRAGRAPDPVGWCFGVTNELTERRVHKIVSLEIPQVESEGIILPVYVRCTGLSAPGRLELWAFITTDQDPMLEILAEAELTDTASEDDEWGEGWRLVELKFDRPAHLDTLVELGISVSLPGGAQVAVAPKPYQSVGAKMFTPRRCGQLPEAPAEMSTLATNPLAELSWVDLQADGLVHNGTVLPPDEETPLVTLGVENPDGDPTTIPLTTIVPAGLQSHVYAVVGQVRYCGVEGEAYLEMWSHFPDGGRYFTRTLAQAGPMQHLSGCSGWRRFLLPFTGQAGGPLPERLEINLVLPGQGSVQLSPLLLVEYVDGEVVYSLSWSGPVASAPLSEGTILAADGDLPARLAVECTDADVRSATDNIVFVPLWTIPEPNLTPGRYVLRGEFAHEDLSGEVGMILQGARLWIWRYKTIGKSGSAESHIVEIAFEIGADDLPVRSLTVQLAFHKSTGVVEVGPLEIIRRLGEADHGPTHTAEIVPSPPQTQAWFTSRQSRMIGGITGSVFGCLGGVIGALAGRGKARAFVQAALKTMIGLGLAMLAVGVVAAVCSQPYHVYYMALLPGVLLTVLAIVLLPVVRRRYAEVELRKMSAMDVG